MDVAVVIPIYKDNLSRKEVISLKQCFSILGNYPIFFVLPKGLILNFSAIDFNCAKAISFNKKYFTSTKTYSQLLLSPKFYFKFREYKYILIYQLDAYVFKDELSQWCLKGYDYIGAPWVDEIWPQKTYESYLENKNLIKRTISKTVDYNKGKKISVGNGGFSLRKVKSFLRISCLLKLFKGNFSYIDDLHEDVFWSIYVPKYFKKFNIPDVKEAIKFSFEKKPGKLYEMNGNKLPFGCHAWDIYEPDFWKKHFNCD